MNPNPNHPSTSTKGTTMTTNYDGDGPPQTTPPHLDIRLSEAMPDGVIIAFTTDENGRPKFQGTPPENPHSNLSQFERTRDAIAMKVRTQEASGMTLNADQVEALRKVSDRVVDAYARAKGRLWTLTPKELTAMHDALQPFAPEPKVSARKQLEQDVQHFLEVNQRTRPADQAKMIVAMALQAINQPVDPGAKPR